MPRKPQGIVRIGLASIYPQTGPQGGWRASIPKPHGQGRIRKRFRTLDDAKAWARANASIAKVAAPLTASETILFRDAAKMLPPGATVLDAARAYASASPSVTDRPVPEAVAEYLESKRAAGRRPDTLRDYAAALARLPSYNLSELSADSVAASVSDLNPRRHNNVLASLSTFFRWCVARSYLAANPAASIDKTAIDWTPPKIYTPGQTSVLFALAEEVAPRLVPFLAMSAFAGIRTSGTFRLKPDAIDFSAGIVTVPGYADKLRRGYITPLSDTLRKWLEVYPFTGWRKTASAFYNAQKAFFDKLPFQSARNALRHSYASYLYAKTQDIRAVASALGHLGEVDTLLRSYRNLTKPALAESYFSIRPTIRS